MNIGRLLLIKNNLTRKVQEVIYKKIFISIKSKRNIINHFHGIYYESPRRTRRNTFWLGVKAQKCPLDLWIYQEIIFETRPDIIVESGTASGGSALFLASICDLLGKGEIISIDIEDEENRPGHPRIKYLLGSSTSKEIVEKVQTLIEGKDRIMAILDSDHHKEHVLRELEIYSKFVTRESYIIVEDTNINGHPVKPKFGPGPMEAVNQFLTMNNDFIIDRSREKFYLTFNPDGYLKKLK
jgi:cephalosporin hydroxylase